MKASELFESPADDFVDAPASYPWWNYTEPVEGELEPYGPIHVLGRAKGHVVSMSPEKSDTAWIFTDVEFERAAVPVRLRSKMVIIANEDDLEGIKSVINMLEPDKQIESIKLAFANQDAEAAMAATRLLVGAADLSFLYE